MPVERASRHPFMRVLKYIKRMYCLAKTSSASWPSTSMVGDFPRLAHQDGLEQHGGCERADERQGEQLAHAGCPRVARQPETSERRGRGHGAEDHGTGQG